MLAQPRAHWFIVCSSDELNNKPLGRQLFGTPLVLFRDESRRAAALLDRCAHRNVPLSVGSVVQNQLQCAYHGWRYDGSGVCRVIPGLCGAAEGKARRVPVYATCEQQGYVWVYGQADVVPATLPYHFDYLDDAKYSTTRYEYRFDASLYATLENILDVPHTAFLHGGLFRSASAVRHKITAIVRRGIDRVEAQYVGEPVPKGLIGRLLAPQGGQVEHFDRFILPSIAQVEYVLGDSRVMVTDALTPVDDYVTELRTLAAVRLPVASGLVSRVVGPVARFIATQDASMLRLQSERVQRFGGEQFVSTEIDVLGAHIVRLLRAAERGEVLPEGAAAEERVELMV